jgi:hypothetical protein
MNSIKNLSALSACMDSFFLNVQGLRMNSLRRLGISERLVYHLVEQFKDFDAKIGYDRSRRTYCYDDNFDLESDCRVRWRV